METSHFTSVHFTKYHSQAQARLGGSNKQNLHWPISRYLQIGLVHAWSPLRRTATGWICGACGSFPTRNQYVFQNCFSLRFLVLSLHPLYIRTIKFGDIPIVLPSMFCLSERPHPIRGSLGLVRFSIYLIPPSSETKETAMGLTCLSIKKSIFGLDILEGLRSTMGKGAGVKVKTRVNSMRSSLPFDGKEQCHDTPLPRSLKDKQRSWMMAGLRKLKAPIATWFILPACFNNCGNV